MACQMQSYVDQNMHVKEADAIFRQGWAAIGFGCDVPKPGCVYPVDMLGIPLLMVRTKKNEVHIFENVCRHRGMILVEEAGQLNGPITCPYHAWSYDLEGALKATPHVGGPNIHNDETVICENLSLNRVRSVMWRDVVFVNLSGLAPEFSDIARPLRERWAEFEQPIYSGGAVVFTLEVDCNWKLAVENYCEAYHLPFIHPGLNSYSRLEDHYNILDDEIYAGQGSYVFKPQLDKEEGVFLPLKACQQNGIPPLNIAPFSPMCCLACIKIIAMRFYLPPMARPKPQNGSVSIMQMKQL